jgi:hypothetical protein
LCFRIFILVALYLILDLLVLLKQQPEHLVELLAGLEGHLLAVFHSLQLFLEQLNSLDVCELELALVSHKVLMRADDVFVNLMVESLS